MRLNVFAALFAILLWGAAPAFAGPPPDVDGDGVADYADNCIDPLKGANPAQDDTDADDCGNVCDADYNQSGGFVDLPDLFDFIGVFLTTDALHNHTEPVSDVVVLADLFAFIDMFTKVPGPSGTTVGTPLCP